MIQILVTVQLEGTEADRAELTERLDDVLAFSTTLREALVKAGLPVEVVQVVNGSEVEEALDEICLSGGCEPDCTRVAHFCASCDTDTRKDVDLGDGHECPPVRIGTTHGVELLELAQAIRNDSETAVARWGSREEQAERIAVLVFETIDKPAKECPGAECRCHQIATLQADLIASLEKQLKTPASPVSAVASPVTFARWLVKDLLKTEMPSYLVEWHMVQDALRARSEAIVKQLIEGGALPAPVLSEQRMPAFKIVRHDGTNYTTSMAVGMTVEKARAYFMGQVQVDEDPETGVETRRTVVAVEEV